MLVRDPGGQAWRVSRRWVPWRRRLKGSLDVPDLPLGFGDDPISLVLGVIGLVLLAPFILLAVVAGLELLALLLVFPFALLARAAFGQHWTVEVRRGWRPWSEVEAGDWQASGVRIHELAATIEKSGPPPRTLGA